MAVIMYMFKRPIRSATKPNDSRPMAFIAHKTAKMLEASDELTPIEAAYPEHQALSINGEANGKELGTY